MSPLPQPPLGVPVYWDKHPPVVVDYPPPARALASWWPSLALLLSALLVLGLMACALKAIADLIIHLLPVTP